MSITNIKVQAGKKSKVPAELVVRMDSKGRVPHTDEDFHGSKHQLDKLLPNITTGLQRELKVTEMGYPEQNHINWSEMELPLKTELHKLLYHRISNYANPDILIKIGNYKFRCHLLLLRCYSSYFNENHVTSIEISETSVTKTAFILIYDWMLHLGQDSHKLLTRSNILEILKAAQFLGIKELEEQCWALLGNADVFSEGDAFQMYLNAKKQGNPIVMEIIVPRIRKFFLTLVSSKDYLELDVEDICTFLTSNYICIHGEIEVFMSAVRWLVYDWENRSQFLIQTMKCIRFGWIAPWQLVYIQHDLESPEVLLCTKSEEVSRMIQDGLAFATIKEWYKNNSTIDYHKIDIGYHLGLTEPMRRNWADTEKNYLFYRDFLNELKNHRRLRTLEEKNSKCVVSVDTVESNGLNDSAAQNTERQ